MMPRAPRLLRPTILLAIACALAVPQHGLVSQQEEGDVQRILARSLVEPAYDPELLRSELLATGTTSIAALLDVLARREVPHGPSTLALGRKEELVVLGTLARSSGSDLRAYLGSLIDSEADVSRRQAALRVLARSGSRADLELAAQLAPRSKGAAFVEPSVRSSFAETCDRILERDAGSLAELANLARRVHPSLFPGLIRRLAADPSAERVRLLVGLLGIGPEADVLVLAEVGRVARESSVRLEEWEARILRSYLARPQGALIRLSTRALADFRDTASIAALIELTAHEDRNVRKSAHEGLVALTGMDLGVHKEPWLVWIADERAWWERGDEALRTIQSDVPGAALEAIRQVGRHRLDPESAERLLLAGLERAESAVVVEACRVLGGAVSKHAPSELVALLRHPVPEVRAAAQQALERITGFAYREPDHWKRQLGLE